LTQFMKGIGEMLSIKSVERIVENEDDAGWS
jgi:hypothetical protein